MPNTRLKIVMVGGGSVNWAPNILRDMLLTPSLARAEYVLLDIDKGAAELTKSLLDKLARGIGASPRIVATDRRAALAGADYVVVAISTGGLDAMAHDLAIPEKFGIFHTVGDTSGPGGWARLIRNFDVFTALARDLRRWAPRAVVLNYTNPMTALTDVLCRMHDGPVVGLCHGLFENLTLFKTLYGLKSEDDLAVHYGGINHFFWITRARAGKIDILEDLSRRTRTRSFTDILADHRDVMGHASVREVATELFRTTGVMPYLGDRHTSEFFPWYITSRENLKKYRLVRTTIADRKRILRAARRRVEHVARNGKVPDHLKHRTRETAADIIDAHSQGRVFIDVGNLPNTGQISNLPRGLVVETAVRVDRNGITPLAFGELPTIVKGFIDPYAALFPMLVDACLHKNIKLAMQALRLDPVCNHLNCEQVQYLGEKLIAAHKRFVTAF